MPDDDVSFGILDGWVDIPLEVQEQIARDLAKRIQEEHIRTFGSCTVVVWRPNKEE
jgi:hypothetical protein